jgi:hypothetical protein
MVGAPCPIEFGGVSNIQQISDESEGRYHDMDESQGAVCNEYRALKQEYESALREVELYESGGAIKTVFQCPIR